MQPADIDPAIRLVSGLVIVLQLVLVGIAYSIRRRQIRMERKQDMQLLLAGLGQEGLEQIDREHGRRSLWGPP